MSTGNPQFIPKPALPNVSEKIKSAQEIKLQALRQEIEGWKDRLEQGIDEGIKETVVMLNAFEFPTVQSCEGHIDPKIHTEEYSPAMAPWVMIYPQEPDQENWEDSDELRKKVTEESEKYLSKIVSLLDEFYNGQEVPNDVKLTTDQIAYGFRIQSGGMKSLENPNDKSQQEKAVRYKEEMKRFTEFLKSKFLSRREEV